MVSGSRPCRKSKEVNDDSRKKENYGEGSSRCSFRKTDVSGLMKTSRETSLSREMTQNSQSKQKSMRLDKPISPSTPRITNKSERHEKQSTPSPLRRSDRNKKNMSSSSNSKRPVKEFSLSNFSREKDKTESLIQVLVDTEKTESALESVGVRRKNMDARSFRSLFKRQQIKIIFPDVDRELEGQDNISHICNGIIRESGCKTIRNGVDTSDVGKLRDQSLDRASDGDLHKSICSVRGCDAEILGNDASIDSNHIDYVVDEIPELCHGDGLKDNRSNSSVRETYDDSERLPTNCLTPTNTNAPVPRSSTCLESSQYCAVSTENGEICLEMKVSENVPPSSANCETPSLLGTCVLCKKNKRVSYGSPEQELCSCSATLDDGLSNLSGSKDGGDHGAAVPLESFEHCCSRNPYREINSREEACVICGEVGSELLCCWGNGCNRCYHLSCLDPPLTCALPGVWHCPRCVYKKFALGVHSVSKRIESIWDVREVKATNAKGMHRQKQYFVKYHGLAHVHNNWLSDNQLCPEKLRFFFNFIAKDQIVRWSSEWTVPHRLLRKRPVLKFEVLTSTDISECHYEWLVKWDGLDYDHSSWELDSACFLRSSLGQKLMRDYEIRLENAKKLNKHQKGSFVALSEITLGESPVNDSNLLKNVNELRYCWFNCQNAVVFNNQDRVITLILFIQSMIAMCQPFLIIASSESFSLWEAEFARVAPSVDVVIYGGNRETRKGIRASEFYEEGGCVMLQVLLSSMQAVLEDLDVLQCIRWKAIIIDDYQHSVGPDTLRPIKNLASDLTIFLINDRKEPQDMTSEYLNLLPWLDSHDDFGKIRCLNFSKDDNSCKLERLLCCTSIERTSKVSKFVEYWIPVQISNYQLELYCDALLNSNALRSSSRSDLVGALRDILRTVRKCCDHPYLVDTSIQKALFAEHHPAAEILEIGIKASGKLHVLDLMLSVVKTRGLQVMILFQMLVGPEGATIGDILDDFCRQRFGENTYERVDARVINSRKQAAVDRFNKRETGQFIFLLENRACSSSIKLSSLDLIIIYDSDWNPANDLRALQKISIDSKVEQIKVFRLYSSCTVEERALVLAKQNMNLNTSLQRLTGRVTYDTLLMWGASYLFSILDEYHAVSSSIDLRSLSGQLLLNEVIMEFHAIVSSNCDIFYINPLISKVTLHDGYYKSNSRNFGEAKVQLMDGVEPCIFWRNLLNRKNPQWKHLKGQCPQNRKRVQCLVEPSRSLGCENGDASKKRKQVVNDNVDPSSVQDDLSENPITQIAGSEAGNYTTVASNQFQSLPIENSTTSNNPNCVFGQSSFPAGVYTFESEERFLLLPKRKSLRFLQGEVTRICQLLKISDDVVETARRFLEYVIKNHDARSDSPAIMQAFQISLCWVAALISKQKVDKKHSLLLAKQHLNYECTEEQVNSVYSKMQSLIWMYLQCSQNANDSNKDCLLADEVNKEPSNVSEELPLNSSSCKLKKVKIEIEEELFNEEHLAAQISLHEKLERLVKAAGSEIQDEMKKKIKKCEKRMKKLIRKQEEEMRELQRILDKQRVKLEETHKVESAVTRSIHDQGSVAIFKLKILDDSFAKKMEEHNLLKDMQLKDLKARQLATREVESQKATNWLAEAIACSSELRIIKGPQTLGSQSNGYSGCSQGNYVAASDPSTSARAVTLVCNDPSATLYNLESVNSDNEVGIMSLERSPRVADKQLDHLIHSYDATRETASGELVSCQIQLEEPNKEALTEVPRNVSNKVVSHVDTVVLGNASNGGDLTGLPDSMVNQIDRPDETTDSGSLLNHVSENKIHQHLLSTELQDREPAVEIPSTLHIEVATLELIDTATVFQSNREESTGNHELLHAVAVDASLSCNQSRLSETEHPIQNQERSPSQSAAARETTELFDVFISQSFEPSQLQDCHLDLGSSSRFNSDQSMELFASSPNNTAIAEAVVSTSELPNQAFQLRLDSGCVHGSRNLLVHPIQQVASWNSTPSSLVKPLEDEVERLRKEVEQLEKTHENVMSQLRSDCEKEIEEIIDQIRSKYEAKIKDAEAEFRLKRNEVDKNRNIVLMNKKLAEAFRSKCVDFKASRRPGMQQAFPSGLVPLPSTRLASAASASRAPRQQAAAPFQQMLQHQPIPNSISSPVASQNVTAPPPVQVVPVTGPQISGCSSRPPVISGFTSAANPHVGREISSPASHLQSFTPAVPPLVGGQIRSPASHLHPFRSAAPPHVGRETRSQGSHFQPFRHAEPTSTAIHQHLPKQKYRRLDQLP